MATQGKNVVWGGESDSGKRSNYDDIRKGGDVGEGGGDVLVLVNACAAIPTKRKEVKEKKRDKKTLTG